MNTIKILLSLGFSAVVLTTFTACQIHVTTPEKHKMSTSHMQSPHPEHRGQHKVRDGRLYAQIRQACEGKAVGSQTEIRFKDKTLTGQCNLVFIAKPLSKAERLKQREAWQASAQAERRQRYAQKNTVLSDAERNTLVKQYEQRLIQQQAKQTAFANACKDQTAGKAVSIQVGQQQQQGTCQVIFTPDLNKVISAKS